MMAFETSEGVLKLIVYVAVVADGKILLVQYADAPNPSRAGWWVPAPEMTYGQGPDELAKEVLVQLGLDKCEPVLVETESFTSPGGWHCMFHFRAQPQQSVAPNKIYSAHAWFGADQLPPAEEFAHGEWERRLALRRLGDDAK